MPVKKRIYTSVFVLCALLLCGVVQGLAQSQTRPRIVKTSSSRPTNAPPEQVIVKPTTSQPVNSPAGAYRPTMVNKIVLAMPSDKPAPLMKNEPARSVMPMSPMLAMFNQKLNSGIMSRMGIRYVYGTEGPNTYDCSGFVWSVFQEAGISFERSSARTYWNQFEPATEENKYQFGTLVFLNGLGHMGIVADEKGFYHASSSKGITYSPFAGYWGKRIVGFRRVPVRAN